MRIAAIRLDASACPVPAMSNAVPWSGLVRTSGRPSVTLTPLLHAQVLHRDQALVVVHRHHHIKLTRLARLGARAHEHRVGRERALTSMPSTRAPRNGGRDDVDFFPAKQPAFTGMRVEPRHRDARRAAQQLRCKAAWVMRRVCNTLSSVTASMARAATHGCSPAPCATRHWPASCAPASRPPPCPDARPPAPAAFRCARESGVRRARGSQCLLVQRRRHQRGNLAAQGGLRGPDHAIAPASLPGLGADRAQRHRLAPGCRPAAPECSAAAPSAPRPATRSSPPASGIAPRSRSTAAARRRVATSPATKQPARAASGASPERLGNDFRADAGGDRPG